MITGVATDPQGRIVSSAITVSVDQTAPIINIEYPKTCHITCAAWIDIRGMVNDAVEGAFGAPELSISILGANNLNVDGQVADRHFQISQVPLRMDLSTFTIRSTDFLRNMRQQAPNIHRFDTALACVMIRSGHNQTGAAITELLQSLKLLVLNADGLPAINQAVAFNIERGRCQV